MERRDARAVIPPAPVALREAERIARDCDRIGAVERIAAEGGAIAVRFRAMPAGCVAMQLLMMTIEGEIEAAGFGLPRLWTAPERRGAPCRREAAPRVAGVAGCLACRAGAGAR